MQSPFVDTYCSCVAIRCVNISLVLRSCLKCASVVFNCNAVVCLQRAKLVSRAAKLVSRALVLSEIRAAVCLQSMIYECCLILAFRRLMSTIVDVPHR